MKRKGLGELLNKHNQNTSWQPTKDVERNICLTIKNKNQGARDQMASQWLLVLLHVLPSLLHHQIQVLMLFRSKEDRLVFCFALFWVLGLLIQLLSKPQVGHPTTTTLNRAKPTTIGFYTCCFAAMLPLNPTFISILK